MKTMKTIPYLSLLLIFGMFGIQHCLATNGMNLEGYGPVALGMGGAAIATDTTTAAVMNNPATLSLQEPDNQFNIALGVLGPDVATTSPDGQVENSNADAFFMPAMGYVHKKGNLSYGLAVFGQGGMGTHYSSKSFLSAGSGKEVHSCVSVGRLIVPLAYKVYEQLTIAATVDFVWAGMNLDMPMSGAQFVDLTTPGMQNSGQASGSLMNSMMPFMMAGYQLDWAHFSFNSDTQLSGEALGMGYAGKIGLLYEISPELKVGIVYQTQTAISDLESKNATMSFQMSNATPPPGYPPVLPVAIKGKIKVVDFEWPALFGVGLNYKFNERFSASLDVKNVNWSDVMEDFTMNFVVNQDAGNDMTSMGGPNMKGQEITASLYQNWDDQLIVAVGGEYLLNNTYTLRFGYNYAENPIPDQYLNPLFPATVENHITGGFGVKLGERSRLDFGASIALEKEVSIPTPMGNMKSTHRQINGQLMYSFNW
jgi:long-chain fatty acid transport protein